VQGDLADDVRAGAEAVEPEARRIARHAQRAVPDEPGAQQRRRLEVAEALGQGERVAAVGHRARRVAAVAVEARELGALAEVLALACAEAAGPVGPAQPRDADAGARRVVGLRARLEHGGDDLVAGITGSREPRTSPSRMCRSVRHTPHAWTSTSTSPGRPGSSCGSGTSRARSGRPGSSRTIARTAA
jgi:hypothetical protein